ncbi:MAG: hypothetical protein AB203_02385 [Parcubacteria bacterium C7867-008]|nr:MAG: hypothetical protein AB203_02385 [Parcubacteria bacterium C7867-008]
MTPHSSISLYKLVLVVFIVSVVTIPQMALAATVDLKVNDSDSALSYSGKKKLNLSWVGTGVQNCDIYVGRGTSFKVKSTGTKKLKVSSDAPYVSFNCNDAATGKAISDYVYITDPKGTSGFSVTTNDTHTVTAYATGKRTTPVCVGEYFGTIKWGDRSSNPVGPELKNQQCGTDVTDMQTHWYQKAGKYTVTFTDWAGRTHKEKVTIP